MEKFKAYLTVDDWKTTDLLPPGWFYRQKRTERGFTYLNQMFEHFRTMIAMFDHLRQEGYGEEAVEKFEKGFRTLPMEPIPMKPIKTVNNEPEAKKNLAKKTKVKKEPVEKEIVKEVDTETMEALLKECDAEDAEDNMSEAEDEHTELGWEEEDEWLPPGWKVAAVKFGEVERRRYQSPCGKHFASSSGDKTAKVWDSSTWQVIVTLPQHSRYVTGCSLSVESKYMATCCENYIQLWKLQLDPVNQEGVSLAADDAEEVVPEEFYCPITCDLMKNPVKCSDGFTYEESAIKEWLTTRRNTSPMTNLEIKVISVTPDVGLKERIDKFRRGR